MKRQPVYVVLGLLVALLLAACGAQRGPAVGEASVSRASASQAGEPFRKPLTTAECRTRFGVACYLPAQLERAYGVSRLLAQGVNGRGQTIILVEPHGSPTIRSDLARFDAVSGLPAPPALTVLRPAGRVPRYDPRVPLAVLGAGEMTLDVDAAHLMAPDARIVVLETPVIETEGITGFPQIARALLYALRHHLGGVISLSLGATEQTFSHGRIPRRLQTPFVDAAADGVTVVAATGDSGATNPELDYNYLFTHRAVDWPASDPLVTAVGGTKLSLNAKGQRQVPDRVWNESDSGAGPSAVAGGGGRSAIFARPSYQNSVAAIVGRRRGIPDVSMSAACSAALEVYQSFPGLPAGWYTVCGTSLAAPLFAGVVALADQLAGHPLGLINPALYALAARHAPGIIDIRSGNNSVSFEQHGKRVTVHGYAARRGYDLASGVGTIYAPAFVRELAHSKARAIRALR